MERGTGRGLVLGLVGEVMLGRGVARGVEVFGVDHPLGAVAPLLGEADACFGDLACVLTARRTRNEGEHQGAYLRAHPSVVEALRRAGIAAVSVANDHALDYGNLGLVDTLAALDAAGVGHAGAGPDLATAERAVRVVRGGWRVSLLAFAAQPAAWAAGPSSAGIRYLPLDAMGLARARAAIVEERRHADLLLVSLHWGAPLRTRPEASCRAFARGLVEAGADVVWGHGARVPQGVEWCRGRPILYDTGALVDDEAIDDAQRNDLGGVFLVHAWPGRVESVEILPTRIRGARAEPAEGLERDRFLGRLAERCRELGTVAGVGEGRLRVLAPMPELVG